MNSLIGNQLYENSNIFLKEIHTSHGGKELIFTIPNRNRRLEPARLQLYIKNTACIPDMWVPKDMRNMGLATELLLAAISVARSRGVKKIELDNMTGNGNKKPSTLYERVGFVYEQEGHPEMYLNL
jgi:GNAT superfamily N-acetyltransferase